MGWIKIVDAARLTKKPARTIRHQALLGKLKANKKGRDWYVHLSSLKENGWVDQSYQLKTGESELLPVTEAATELQASDPKSSSSEQEPPTKKEKRAFSSDVRSLGVYKELLEFCCAEKFRKINSDGMRLQTKRCLACLAIGYFEFNYADKLNSYKEARQHLLRFLVSLHLKERSNTDNEEIRLIQEAQKTVSEILPGISGLIRKTEKRAYAKHPGTKGSSKGRKSDDRSNESP
jgi:hypothetical protein